MGSEEANVLEVTWVSVMGKFFLVIIVESPEKIDLFILKFGSNWRWGGRLQQEVPVRFLVQWLIGKTNI